MDSLGSFQLGSFYDAFPRVESAFQAALDESLYPRGPELVHDLVGDLGLLPGAVAIDVGCGEGRHALKLAERHGFAVFGFDPVERHVELARAALAAASEERPRLRDHVAFALGVAETLPVVDACVDLIWCRDVMVHVTELGRAYLEFRRVLRRTGRVLIYQMFATDRLEPLEATWLFRTMGVVPSSAPPHATEAAISSAGLRIDDCLDLGTEWGEFAEEQSGRGNRQLVHAARLLRDPERYVSRFGQSAYDIMFGDCLWHVYRMIGKLSPRIYVLSVAETS